MSALDIILITLFIVLLLMFAMNIRSFDNEVDCSEMGGRAVKNIPARCLYYFKDK